MNTFPDGRLNPDDEGALAVSVFTDQGRVVIEFGKQLSWIGFGKDNLRAFIDLLESKYKNL